MSEQKFKIFNPKDYETEFNPEAYLHFYYSSKALDDGTRLSLFSLPMFAYMIQAKIPEDKRQSLIDIGAGPTVYSAISFRNVVKRVYLTDYVEKSLTMLDDWLYQRTPFSWKRAIHVIARTEGVHLKNDKEVNEAEEKARKLVENGGIFKADVHTKDVLILNDDQKPKDKMFDIAVSVFCLESACSTHDEYKQALKNIISLIRPGGYLILGSVIDDVMYNSGLSLVGDSKLFTLLDLDEDFIENAMDENGMDLTTMHKYSLDNDGVAFFMIAKNS
jgi:SAM-dependent methyltransferase